MAGTKDQLTRASPLIGWAEVEVEAPACALATHDWMVGRRAKTVSRLVSFSDRASSTGLDGLSDVTMCFAITCVRGWGQEETTTGWIETHNIVCN